jgi:hypothetical protein
MQLRCPGVLHPKTTSHFVKSGNPREFEMALKPVDSSESIAVAFGAPDSSDTSSTTRTSGWKGNTAHPKAPMGGGGPGGSVIPGVEKAGDLVQKQITKYWAEMAKYSVKRTDEVGYKRSKCVRYGKCEEH